MRTARLIITTLLALQLFAATGLCGGACCATNVDRMVHNAPAAKEDHQSATEEKIEGGHCPMHAAQKAGPKPPERKLHSPGAAQRLNSQGNHYGSRQARSSATANAHFCACEVERREQSFDALLQRAPEKRPIAQTISGAFNPNRWLIELSAPQNFSLDSFQPHSPPFGGRHLNLRI